jgi:DNA recombination protein RmuC
MFDFFLVALGVGNFIAIILIFLKLPQHQRPYWQDRFSSLEKNQEHLDRLLREEIARNRDELRHSFHQFSEAMLSRVTETSTLQTTHLDSFLRQLSHLTQLNEQKLETLSKVIEDQLKSIEESNSQKLEEMREVVDEKLHSTLEKRLGESFQLVSERLEKVHQGLGEMQNLASGVGDLKKVLVNVKTRGMWGEVQLGNLLDQILSPEQYEKNVITKRGTRDMVEFAIKLPGPDRNCVFLPIDAKFPIEDYERLQEAQEQANLTLIEEANKAIETCLQLEAKNIREKYLDPPYTTDFGILFLPTEGLYAEVLRRPGFCDGLRKEYRVLVTGPITIAALLNSLQMGFRTLAVEKRAGEVWALLGTVKTEFSRFGEMLEKTQKKLRDASETIEDAAKKSRTIEKKLKDVQDLPLAETSIPRGGTPHPLPIGEREG